jgi:hypothetical protein
MTLRTIIENIINQGKSIDSTVRKIIKAASDNGLNLAEQTVRYVLQQDSSNNEKLFIILDAVEEY